MAVLSKSELRKKYSLIRKNIENRDLKNNVIFRKVIQSEVFKNSDTVFCYVSTEYEVDTFRIIEYSLKNGKKVACPVCKDKNGSMEFYYIDSISDLRYGMYGIYEPKKRLKKAPDSEKSLCIVPCICCDSDGYRVGYGKGYYDRFLRSFKGKTVLLCYGECKTENIPFDDFDIKCDFVVEER